MTIPRNRLDIPKLISSFIEGTANGITIAYNNITKKISIAIAYNETNLKINAEDKLDTIQDIDTTASPEFAGMTIGTDTGLVSRDSGVIGNVTIGSGLTLESGVLSSDAGDYFNPNNIIHDGNAVTIGYTDVNGGGASDTYNQAIDGGNIT